MTLTRIIKTSLIIIIGAVIICTPQAASEDPALSDADKKKIVYEMYERYKKGFPTVQDISAPRIMALMNTGKVVFVDTRTPEEMAVSMLPGALPKTVFLKQPKAYRNDLVVGYCTISYRSGKFAEKMAEEGVRMYNLTGGLLAWVLEGGKIYDAGGETRRIHVYGEEWNYPPAGYTSVMFNRFDRIFMKR
ncbi:MULTISPECIES: rhodanese-like domain-containing protein [Desulfococcus]|uniref:Rhodanese-like protein n=1 Tax=Desulfococcus multivorans DSM 2059 TaxID=1121405 RepID=S7TQQ8_DESML|nr:rhodanese-like domain-containing protein [Desulfococcus multivorans]AOY57917.1 rhodanese domain protein [Desulfococcus multivorans]AQV00292.1 rhodanese [Desulfococcus multivorans]EPR39000.1 Rhodanese-like protein [Desulfococcus multivorans DSM 2059]SJZ65364.1 Rhodanese-related sulfurtransferase [Desulfococcus multivorans DSM 2059]